MSKSAKEFEEYLIQLAINQTIELEKIKAFLGEINEADQQSINQTLAPKHLAKLKLN
jgi:hypothetical protein